MSSKLRHYRLEKWADYVRGVLSRVERDDMAAHLQLGCRDCGTACDYLTKVAALGRVLAQQDDVPAELVRFAESLLPVEGRPRTLPRLSARLQFDSWLQPAPAGIRSGALASRQAIYRAGQYCVDIRVEKHHESQRMSLVGQIANQDTPDAPMGAVPVAVRCGDETLAAAASNEHGEFQLEYEPKRRLQLVMSLADREIEVSLGKFSAWKG